mgnify:FL=1
MSDLPNKTDIPEYIDVNFANTLDLHIACTDMLSHLDKYANQQALVLMWNATKHAADPITAQAEFFNQLNTAINIKTASKVDKENVNYFSKLDAELEPNEVWLLNEEGEIDRTDDGAYLALNAVNGTGRQVEYKEETEAFVNKKIELLSEEYKVDSLDENFLLFWIEKFQRCHYKVKELVKDNVPSKENAFREFSDSIGLVTRVHDAIDDRLIPFVEPYYELIKRNIGDELVEAYPNTTNSVLNGKLDKGTKFLQIDGAVKAGHMFRRNMQVMHKKGFGNPQLSTNAHGENLVTDWQYLTHMSNALVTELNGTLTNNFLPALAKILTFLQLQNDNNLQNVKNHTIQLVVENDIQKVDLLMNKINALTKTVTNEQILKSTSIDLSDDS